MVAAGLWEQDPAAPPSPQQLPLTFAAQPGAPNSPGKLPAASTALPEPQRSPGPSRVLSTPRIPAHRPAPYARPHCLFNSPPCLSRTDPTVLPDRGAGISGTPLSPRARPGARTYLCGSARARAEAGGWPGLGPGAPAGAERPASSGVSARD